MKESRRVLGVRMRELRKSAGFTQENLGEKTELSYKFIGELERGQVNVSIDSLEKIAYALGVKVRDFFPAGKLQRQVVAVKEKNRLERLSSKDIQIVKKALGILNKIF